MTLAFQIATYFGEAGNAYWTWDGSEVSGSDLGILPERASPLSRQYWQKKITAGSITEPASAAAKVWEKPSLLWQASLL